MLLEVGQRDFGGRNRDFGGERDLLVVDVVVNLQMNEYTGVDFKKGISYV